jgi:hypothetical protein
LVIHFIKSVQRYNNIIVLLQTNLLIIMKQKLLNFFVLTLSVLIGYGNGDPVAVHSALTLSPTPVAVHVPEVQLVDEVVTFTPRDRYMEVTVRYLLHNHSDRTFDRLPYGFPIDYYGSGSAKWEPLDDFGESEQETGWRDGYIRNVCFTLGERQLPWQCSRDSIIVPKRKVIFEEMFDITPDSADSYSQRAIDSLYTLYGEDIYTYTKPVSRRWYYTYLDIPAQSYVVLEVRYTAECTWSQGAYDRKSNLQEYTSHYYGFLRFQYDFTPAAYWGDGHAGHFSASVDTTGIRIVRDSTWLRAFFCYSTGIDGLPMKQKGNTYHYEAQRFNFATAKPFTIDYYLTQSSHQPLDKVLNHCIPPSQYTIEVSGVDPKYPVANLSDLDPATATVLRPDINDSIYITIRFHKPTALEGMLLLNGYTKNAETYRNNARIDSLIVFGSRFQVYTYEGKTDTNRNRQIMLFGEHEWIVKYIKANRLPQKYAGYAPEKFDWQSLVDSAMLLGLSDGPWNSTYYEEIRIIITAEAKGRKYNDLCVSEIMLIGK